MTPRPTNNTTVILAAAKDDLLDLIKKLPCMDEYGPEAAQDLLEELLRTLPFHMSDDGYAIAKSLEEGRLLITLNFPDVEELDNIHGILRNARNKAIADWVKTEGIAVPYAKDQWLLFKHGTGVVKGMVKAVDTVHAHMVLFCPTLGHRPTSGTTGLYVNVEDIIGPTEPEAVTV